MPYIHAAHWACHALWHLQNDEEKLPGCNLLSNLPEHVSVWAKNRTTYTRTRFWRRIWHTSSSVSPILNMRPLSISLACSGISAPSRAFNRGSKSQHLAAFVEISSKRKHCVSYLIMTWISPGISSQYRSVRTTSGFQEHNQCSWLDAQRHRNDTIHTFPLNASKQQEDDLSNQFTQKICSIQQ